MSESSSARRSGDDRKHWTSVGRRAETLLEVHSEVRSREPTLRSAMHNIGRFLAHPFFFLSLVAFHLAWVILNLPFANPLAWDPYPFMLLATIASVEAPFLSLLILMHQRRESRVDELREEIALQVTMHLERQSTISLRLLDEIQQKLNIHSGENRSMLERMMQELDPRELLQNVQRDMRESEGDDPIEST